MKTTVEAVFKAINSANLDYCQFKSVLGLEAAFRGETDFDLFVAQAHRSRLREIFNQQKVVPRFSSMDKTIPGTEDFLLLDERKGSLHHFHVHYTLVFGRKYRKNYAIRDFEVIRKFIVEHSELPIRVAQPEFELFLLLLRLTTKTKTLVSIPSMFGSSITSRQLDEYTDLRQRLPSSHFLAWMGKEFPHFLKGFQRSDFINWEETPRNSSLLVLKRQIEKPLNPWRRASNRLADRRYSINRLLVHSGLRSSWVPGGGQHIAIVGIDGSGKSSIAKDLSHWLSQKLSVRSFYLGYPKHEPLIQLLRFLASLFIRLGLRRYGDWLTEMRNIVAARWRWLQYRKALDLSSRGYLCVFDRYPFSEFWEGDVSMDGPKNKLFPKLIAKEKQYYQRINSKPDVVVALDVSVQIAAKRKSHNSRQLLEGKREGIARLLENRNDVIVLDASQSYKEVLLAVKRSVWQQIV